MNACSLVPRPLPPEERPGTHCYRLCIIYQGICKMGYTCTYRACSFYTRKEIVNAAPDNSLLAKGVSCAVSVVKSYHIQGRAATNHIQSEIIIPVDTSGHF